MLFISHSLELGGAERSLIGLLWAMTKKDLQIDLFLLRHEGELLEAIPPHVNLLSEVPAYTALARPMKKTLREGHILLTAARLYGRIKAKRYVRKKQLGENAVALEYSHKYTCRLMPQIQPNVQYDAVISFLTPHYFTAHNVKANKKICWIHTDYTRVAVDVDSEFQMWNSFDTIVAVSSAVKDGFVSVFPKLKEKVYVVENILPEKIIRNQSNVAVASWKRKGQINLLSIGRFSTPKNFDAVPDICRRIRNKGLDVVWFLIGYGPDEALIRSKIEEYGMQGFVVILGKKDNPYPFLKDCDLYVQPSRYEGKCVAVKEAQLLGKPVVITNYATSASQLDDGVDGLIAPMDSEGCAEKIGELLRDPLKLQQLSSECLSRDYSNKAEVDKAYRLFEA